MGKVTNCIKLYKAINTTAIIVKNKILVLKFLAIKIL